MIAYHKGDVTYPEGTGCRVIVHCCNDIGGWGSGFVVALSQRWPIRHRPSPEVCYRDWYRGKVAPKAVNNKGLAVDNQTVPFALGQVQFVEPQADLWVANLIGQHKCWPIDGVPPVRYNAIRDGLDSVREFCQAQNARVVCPKFGAGLAGGTWDIIAGLLEQQLVSQGVEVHCYEL